MVLKSVLALGLLAPLALATPYPNNDKTVTVTKTKTTTEKVTKTTTEKVTKTKTTTEKETKTSTTTKYKTVSVSVCPSTTGSPVSSTTTTSSSLAGYPSSTTTTSSLAGYSSSTAGSSLTTTTSAASTTTSSAGTQTTTLTATASGTKGLNDYAKATGKLYMGTAADIPGTGELQDKYYMAELDNQHDFGQLTPANIMKWVFVEPEQNVFNFTGGDEFISIAKANNQLVRCHNLNWYNQLPDWINNGQWTNETLTAALVNHISKTVAHFGDNCYAWDVVNEALLDDGTFRESIWYNVTGTSYIYTAFAAAEAAVKANGLKTKLYYNDYNIEYPGVKSTAAIAIVKELQARGIQIDGVGLQSHFIVGGTPSQASQVQNMNSFTTLGVDVAITELDVRTTVPATLQAQQQQVLDYASSIGACNAVARCVGATLWDFDDTYSWIPSTFAGQGYGDVWFQPGGANTPLVRKAAYDGIIDGWTGVTPTLGQV